MSLEHFRLTLSLKFSIGKVDESNRSNCANKRGSCILQVPFKFAPPVESFMVTVAAKGGRRRCGDIAADYASDRVITCQ